MKSRRRREGRIGMPLPRRRKSVQGEPARASASVPAVLLKTFASDSFVIHASETRWKTPRRSWGEIQWAQWALRMKYGYDLPRHLADKILYEGVRDVLNKEPKFHETKFKVTINTIKNAMKLLASKNR
jgi:hypothetical protein